MASAPLHGTTGASRPIRVLIVDDSLVARTLLARMLDEREDFAVVGQAASADAALQLLARTDADIILLDLEMPGGGGLAALPALIAAGRGARVLIVSSSAGDGAEASLAGLRLGAADTLLKPSAGGLAGRFAEALADRLRRIARAPAVAAPPLPPIAPVVADIAPRGIACLGIGASTGGVHALSAFFAVLPKSCRVPILVTQHLPGPFMPYFAKQLAEMADRPARIALDGDRPRAGEILLAPADAHLGLMRVRGVAHVRLDKRRAASGFLPSVDPMLASIAQLHGADGAGVMLSGMGRDGIDGARALVAAGGLMLAQDAASSVVWGMPGAVASAGLARAIAPPAELARLVARAVADAPGANAWT